MTYDTWYDIKLKTFQKIFGLNNSSTQIPTDMMGADYENAMPGAANEALQLLATAGKFIIKSIDIAHIPVKSLLQGSERIRSVERGSITYEADGARSMYYECKGKGKRTVTYCDGSPVISRTEEFDDTASLGYIPHRVQGTYNTSDTVFTNNKTRNYVVVGEQVSLTLIDYTGESINRLVIESSDTTSENGRFTRIGKKVIYTDTLEKVREDVEYSCKVQKYMTSDPSEEPELLTVSTHHLTGLPVFNEIKKVTFESDYPLSVKNVGMYSANYETDADIPPYSEYVRYDLRELADDFYMVDPEHIIYEGNREVSRYTATSDWFEEGYKVLLLKRNMPGNYKIYYKAYPQPITMTTPDDTELVLDPEVSALLPLYIASQVAKDDDISLATIYRNEFEVAYERLVKKVEAPSQEHFVSVTGWI